MEDLQPNAAVGCAEELHPDGVGHYLVVVMHIPIAAVWGCGSVGRSWT